MNDIQKTPPQSLSVAWLPEGIFKNFIHKSVAVAPCQTWQSEKSFPFFSAKKGFLHQILLF